jgi:hypothetical protein
MKSSTLGIIIGVLVAIIIGLLYLGYSFLAELLNISW